MTTSPRSFAASNPTPNAPSSAEESTDDFAGDRASNHNDELLSVQIAELRKRAPILDDFSSRPLGVILGSGLGGLADSIESPVTVSYREIPGLAGSTAAGHRGEFLVGFLESRPIVAMAGRLHTYEGHAIADVTRPVALMAGVGVDRLLVSCAAGGLNPSYSVGDLVILSDHSSWLHGKLGALPQPDLTGAGVPTFRRSLQTCDVELHRIAKETARQNSFDLHRGMYLAVTGPNYETRAECRMMRRLGADLVGMSTVPELLLAASKGVRTLGIAVVTNLALPDAPATADHKEVLDVCGQAADRLQQIVRAIALDGNRSVG
ncbi:purine-nucleoside phosphorylase [Rhodopirellula halodulae]|uniref:purine-nucleoside phosphorylase n=1 Tax=Rhodopirellula halodulae TaxID=2894198 RepID=UPI001E341B22|nr:purine-nucleoside phosphorylase [Rhodopirellula sp. JC737]MCC9658238.1 purine-nucleoside phosphorylase [Rhodopirellula sp. JC737]